MRELELRVACLCAAWCHTCNGYRATLRALAGQRPQLRFGWIDIEDDSDALGDGALDIADFPTVVLMRDARVVFHGSVLPHPATLARLLDALQQGQPLAPGAVMPAAMAAAVWRLVPLRPVT